MNHIYRSLWSAALNTWIAVAETSKSKTKNHNPRRKLLVAGLLACSPWAWALPTGEQVVAGQATVNTPMPGQMQIHQTSPQAIINWQSFSIKPQEIVTIQQPTINATLLNRVVGADASVIQGQLSANGQVFLINPNGVLFSPSAQVDVGGLVASTQSISNADFLNGNYHFTQNFSEGIVTNQGFIRVPAGGVVALIGTQVTNDGTISTPKGTTALAAGKTVDLDFQGDGLVEVKVSQAALDAQVANKGAILADGGRVVLTAQAANELLITAVNQSGVIQARSLIERNGEIILAGGDNGTTQVSGTLNVNGQTSGGKINVTGKNVTIQSVANLTAQASDNGKAGTITVFGDMKNGTVNVAGKLDASAPKQGDGGFIETSAAQVNIADSAKITTEAKQGKSGTWLIDPTDITVAATGGNITGAALGAGLSAGNVTLDTSTGCTGATCTALTGTNGDIFVNNPVTWSANLLTLKANRNININANLNGSSTAKLALNYGLGSASGGATDDYIISKDIKINLPAGANFSTQKGSSGTTYNYQVINSLGAAGNETTATTPATTLQGMANSTNLTGNYALGADIDASATSGWNSGTGFVVIGRNTTGDSTTRFQGRFDGLGHTVTGLYINKSVAGTKYNAGLFGYAETGSVISNIGMLGVNLTATYLVGGLAGQNNGSINNAYATGSVKSINTLNSAGANVDWGGGLVGYNIGTINNSYATTNVTGTAYIGGLVGSNQIGGTITNSYATGQVTGIAAASGAVVSNYSGGLAGNNSGAISSSYATGQITGTTFTGGLVGVNFTGATLTDSYATGQVTGNTAGGLAGQNNGSINKVYATGSVNSINATNSVSANVDWGGGLVGFNYGTISNSYATNTVTGTKYIGGLVGSNYTGATISSSYATGQITRIAAASGAVVDNYAGGLVGYNAAAISNSYATGQITGTTFVGGLVGLNVTGATLTDSYATGQVTGNDNAGGLAGKNSGTINKAYATGSVKSTNVAVSTISTNPNVDWGGGLVGYNIGSISNSYATNNVTGTSVIGGLVGTNYTGGSITNSYATGQVTRMAAASGAVVNNYAGGLAGNNSGAISSSYATGQITGTTFVGGLVGSNYIGATLTSSYATGLATGTQEVGGLVGTNQGVISNSYATGNANGTLYVGGLVGYNRADSTISSSYSTGSVTGSTNGGLVGKNAGTVSTSFWDTTSSGKTTSAGGTGKATADMKKASTFAGWDFSTTGGSSAVWRIYDGRAYPLLRSFLTPLTVTASAISKTYNGLSDSTLSNPTYSVTPNANLFGLSTAYAQIKNVGSYTATGLYSNQQGYDISLVNTALTITPANLTITTDPVSKTYDGTTSAVGSPITKNSTLITGDTLSGGTFAFTDKNVGDGNKTVTVSDVTINDGNSGKNYAVTYTDNTTSTITPASIKISGQADSKVYDGTLDVKGTAKISNSELFGSDKLNTVGLLFNDKNVAEDKPITINKLTVDDGNGGKNYLITSELITGTITPATLTITSNDVTKTYDGTTAAESVAKVADGVLFKGDVLSGGVFSFTDKNVGSNKTVITSKVLLNDGNNGKNYVVTYQDNTQSTITPAILTLKPSSDSKVYDGTTTSTGIATSEGLLKGDTLSGLRQTFVNKNVLGENQSILIVNNKDYTLNDGNGGQNYIAITDTATGTITPAKLTLTANDVVKTYDATTTATSTGKVQTGTLFTGDVLSGGNFAFLDKNVGTNKTVKVSDIKIDDSNGGKNYAVSYVDNTHSTIDKAKLTLTSSDVSKVYDGTTSAKGSVVVANGRLLGSDSFSGGVFAFADKNAGTNKAVKVAQVVVNDGNSGNNYTTTYQDNTHSTITPAELILKASNDSKVYDNTTASTGAVTFSGLVGSDKLSGLKQAFVSKNALGSNQSSLTVNSDYTLSDGNNGQNYKVTMNTATGTITPVNLTITATDVVKTYDGTTTATSTAKVSSGSLLGSDALSGGDFAFLDKNAGSGKAVTVSNVKIEDGNSGNNYSLKYVNNINSLINKANLTISSTDVTKTYDSTTSASGSAVVASGTLFGSDALSGGMFAFTDANVGTSKTVTVSDVTLNDGNGGNNYAVSYTNNTNSVIEGVFVPPPLLPVIIATSPVKTNTSLNGINNLATTNSVTNNVVTNNVVTNNASSTVTQNNPPPSTNINVVNNITVNPVTSLVTANTGSTVSTTTTTSGTTSINASPTVASTPAAVSATSGGATVSTGTVQASSATAVSFSGGETVSASSATDNASASQASVAKTPSNSVEGLVNAMQGNSDSNIFITPVLTIKNSAGQVMDLQTGTHHSQYITLLLEDGTIRVWDLERGVQRRIDAKSKKNGSMNVGMVDEKGELLPIATPSGIQTYDVISSSADTSVPESNVSEFVSSNDATLLLMAVAANNRLSLWDNKQHTKQWDITYQRGTVESLAITDDKRHAAVLSKERGGVYAFTSDLQLNNLTDAVDILDLKTGKTLKSLPSFGEQVIYMQFKDNNTLQIVLANGKVIDWSLATQTKQTVAYFAKSIKSFDRAEQKYAYVLSDGSVQVADNQGHIELNIESRDNPFQHAKLLEKGKKLLTVMASGDLAIWDVASGKKMLRLFSTKQGWTVMDAFGRFDGSEEAMENFVWLAEAEGLSIDNFSENYYEPGLLANVLKNDDYFKGDASAIDKGITLPPKVALQLADKQASDDSVTLQLDVYDRGGGINKVKFYQNGRLVSSESVITAEQKLAENGAEHRVLTLKVTPTSGENTFKVVASNEMDIENSSPDLKFDGKSKAYNASLKVLTIGINRYKEDQLRLNYSVADANLMSDVLKKYAKIAVSKSLLDENATKVKILAALKEFSQGTQNDSLVIYLAGHGVALKKEWYFLPYETQLLPTLKEIVANAISATELSDIFKNSKIQHILLMVDSCHSGGSMDVFSQLENSQRFFTRQLSRSLGITVITAAAKDQEAKELKSLGHGLFTYLMSQELQKNNPAEPVTAHSIAKTILKTLPAFSKMQIGAAQEPVSYMHGSDFILTESLKK